MRIELPVRINVTNGLIGGGGGGGGAAAGRRVSDSSSWSVVAGGGAGAGGSSITRGRGAYNNGFNYTGNPNQLVGSGPTADNRKVGGDGGLVTPGLGASTNWFPTAGAGVRVRAVSGDGGTLGNPGYAGVVGYAGNPADSSRVVAAGGAAGLAIHGISNVTFVDDSDSPVAMSNVYGAVV